MNIAFPDAEVTGYDQLILILQLPDPDDNHVLAAALRCKADVIVTFNLKDFPLDSLAHFDIEVQDPDTFLRNLIDLEPTRSLKALVDQAARLIKPPQTVEDILKTLDNIGCRNSVKMVRSLIGSSF